MMKRNRGRFTTILAVSGEKLPGSVVFPPTDAPLSPRCICRRQRSSITPGTLRVPWAVFLHIQKTASTAKAILAVLAGAEGIEPSALGFGAAVVKREAFQNSPFQALSHKFKKNQYAFDAFLMILIF